MDSKYNLDKIKFGIDSGTWKKALVLYDGGKVKNFQDCGLSYIANVEGANLYEVIVSKKRYTDGNCTCYLGQNDTLCKHMIAVAIYGIKEGGLLTEEEKVQRNYKLNLAERAGRSVKTI